VTRPRIPFSCLALAEDDAAVRAAIDRVVGSGWFVLGPEVEAFEAEFAAATGAAHAVGVGTGTDALALALRAVGVGAGDEVITTPLSAAYTALAILMVGAVPRFADVDPVRLTLDPRAIEGVVTLSTRAIVPVHLYGQAADMEGIAEVAARHGLFIIEDCCQAHLATSAGRPVGTIGAAGAFSFYPTKNLGALGDGGAVITADRALADRVKRLRNGGQVDRYRHEEPGVNSRLDELQAAILRARLPHLGSWTMRRRQLAALYRDVLAKGQVQLLAESDAGHVYHLFVVRVGGRDGARDHLQRRLLGEGIETLVHYPIPIPQQAAFAGGPRDECPEAAAACREVLSLPLHPRLTERELTDVATAVTVLSGRS
jgi:dTDP-4-amino-4,6-dideoxygalactose transaminase